MRISGSDREATFVWHHVATRIGPSEAAITETPLSRLARVGLFESGDMVELLFAAVGVHEALQQSLAGIAYLHAVRSLERRPAATQRLKMVTFPVVNDIGDDYSLAVTDERHRVVFNGIWQVGRGLQLSGVYFYGSGERMPLIYGDDLRSLGEGFESFTPRLRPDCTLVPRNGFVGDPVHRVPFDRRHFRAVQSV